MGYVNFLLFVSTPFLLSNGERVRLFSHLFVGLLSFFANGGVGGVGFVG